MPTTVTVLPQKNRSGTDTSPPAAVPADVDSVSGGLTMSTADQTNPARAVSWVVQASADGGATWTPIYGPEWWQGGTVVTKQGQTAPAPDTVQFSVDPAWRGQLVRAVATNNGAAFPYGMTLTTFP